MYRVLILLICIVSFATPSLVTAQREAPEVTTPRVVKPVRRKPVIRGSRVAQSKGNGVLFVLTDPPEAQVTVKSGNSTVKQERVEDGEFRAELAPGQYDVEVTSQYHQPYKAIAVVRQLGTKPIQADLVPTSGSILIGLGSVDADANILIDGKKPASVKKQGENQLKIENLPIGTHTLKISHPTIADKELSVGVEGGNTTIVTPRFTAAIVNLIIKSEPGAEVSVDDAFVGRTNEAGEYKYFNKIGPGEHTIRVAKDQFEATPVRRRFAVGTETVEVKMRRKEFSEPFSEQFLGGASGWDLPRNMRVTSRKMLANGADNELSVGLVREKSYANFKMEFDVSFTNGKGAAWVVRAKDRKNFYLFQLVGDKGSAQNTFFSYIYENGELRQLRPPEYLALDLSRPNDFFHITVEAQGPSIKHFIEIASSPQAGGRRTLSSTSDRTFTYGTVGFACKEGEVFTVFTVEVNPTR